MKKSCVIGASLALLAIVATAQTIDAPVIEFRSTGIEVSRITPRSRVLLISSTRRVIDYVLTMEHHHRPLTDDDGDGRVRFEVSEVPSDSLWIAVDMVNGSWTGAVPPGSTFERIELRKNGLHGVGGLNRLDVSRQYVEVTWVRPNVGAWSSALGDGGSADTDKKTNGNASLDVDTMLPVRGETAATPKHFLPGDLLFVIDPRNAQWFAIGAAR